jgi:MFS family permease
VRSRALFGWLHEAPADARRSLLAASLGWALDAFDTLLYALILPAVMAALHLTKSSAGLLGSLTLIAAAAGGILLGLAADRYGRTRALMTSVLLYAVFTAACGLAWSFASLALFRILLGLGVGGEWATGASLVAETWPGTHRDKALALMQSAFALGYGLAAIVVFFVQPIAGWRGVFFVGLLPALLTFWIRRRIPEPAVWQRAQRRPGFHSSFAQLFKLPLRRYTIALTFMNACCLFAWWGFNLWVPSYLSLPIAQGGIGFTPRTMTVLIVAMQIGMWFGYVSFGYLATAFGRRRVYVSFLLCAAALIAIYASVRSPWLLVLLGPCLAFVATGYFSGFAAVTAETYPDAIRSTGQGFTYNVGRLASAAAPYAAGTLAQQRSFATAFHLDAAAFLLAAMLWLFVPSRPPAPALEGVPAL